MFKERQLFRVIFILSLIIMAGWLYYNHESSIISVISGRFVMDPNFLWDVGVFFVLGMSVFFLMAVAIHYKDQTEILKKYLEDLQAAVDRKAARNDENKK